MAFACSLSSFLSPPLPCPSRNEHSSAKCEASARVSVRCAAPLGYRPRRREPAPSSGSRRGGDGAARRGAAVAAPPKPKPTPAPRKRHWKEGEFPGASEGSAPRPPPRTPIKNLKKKADDRAAAAAWACTVTEALADRVQKRQWEDALEVPSIKP